MSGGSWDYVYIKIAEAADDLTNEKAPLRRALGDHMKLVAKAMHDIEWVDSCDKGPGDEIEAIRAVLEPDSSAKEIEILLADARKIINHLECLGA